ncbi:MAG: hypothetical protein GXY61_03245 [Lentisphaerae bacterium]|jgi:catabolite regulation protein CreA|nr:hypothetical protein [Lentisphaerota bacterium]
MKKCIPLFSIICLTLAGCTPKPAPVIPNTSLVAEIGPTSLTFQMTGKDAIWQSAGDDPLVCITWQYVGTAVVPELYKLNSDGKQTDVYIVSLKVGDEQIQHIQVQYSGGEYVIIDRPEVKAYLIQK